MHERCETVKHQPRASPPQTNQQSAWRSTMHVKACPKLVRSEVRLEPGNRNPGGVAGVRGRSPLTVISANTLRHGNNNNNNHNNTNGPTGCHGDAWRRKAKGQGGEGLYRKGGGGGGGGGGGATGVEGEGPVDIWAVIKPGNVQQKIAIFTSVGPPIGGSDGWGEDAPPKHEVITTAAPTPVRGVSLKVKGGVRDRESCSSAKRRRRSGSNRHHHQHHHHLLHQQQQQQRELNTGTTSPGGEQPLSLATRRSVGEAEDEEEDGAGGVCVVDMVALLEQKANVNVHTSCTTKAPPHPTAVPATAAPATVPSPAPNEGSEVVVEEEEASEVVRVSDMVARLESECLKRSNSSSGGGLSRSNSSSGTGLSRSNSSSGGGLSRSNSLRRGQPSSPTLITSSSSLLPEVQLVSCALPLEPVRPSEAEHALDREAPESLQVDQEASESLEVCLEEVRGAPRPSGAQEPEAAPPTEDHSDSLNPEPLEEPPPGMLFFSSGPLCAHTARAPTHTARAPKLTARASTHTTQASTHTVQAPTHTPQVNTHTTPAPTPTPQVNTHTTPAPTHSVHAPTQTAQVSATHTTHAPPDPCSTTDRPLSSSSSSLCSSEEARRSSSEDEEEQGGLVVASFPLQRSVSQEFLAVRQRIQRLLDPQPFLTLLPHHLLVHIFSLLPTCSLAALQCSCHYFRLVIQSYGIRPADSRWVSDPRYRDDPCKQCKRRYGRGDVSLCRWHHKPYCQAHPYGPGFWMCCHGSRRDAPGCNVGLHDNRWVPAFHSINPPVYRRGGAAALGGQRHEDSMED